MTSKQTNRKKWLWLIPVLLILVLAGVYMAAPAPSQTESAPAPSPEPTPEPVFALEPGYFETEGLLFFPEDPIAQGDAEKILAKAAGEKPKKVFVTEPLTETTLPALLEQYFDPEAVEEAMLLIRGRGDALITRAEAVVCLNRLSGLTPMETDGYYPDVAPEYWAYGDILTASTGSGQEPLTQGLVNLAGYLYCVDSRGYFRTNLYLDALYFDHTGRYTSGNRELDDYVAAAIRENTTPDMTREEMLRSMYLYVRNSFEYLRRNYYLVGDTGWQVQEALTMYSTGKGNCYCYASAFWAAARGLGYSAKIVSGTIGVENSPHGWVEIMQSGERRTFDVEIEMAQHRDGYTDDMYNMSDKTRQKWNYIEYTPIDNMLPRETEPALQPE